MAADQQAEEQIDAALRPAISTMGDGVRAGRSSCRTSRAEVGLDTPGV